MDPSWRAPPIWGGPEPGLVRLDLLAEVPRGAPKTGPTWRLVGLRKPLGSVERGPLKGDRDIDVDVDIDVDIDIGKCAGSSKRGYKGCIRLFWSTWRLMGLGNYS